MLIFATNAVDSFSEKYRKRMVSLKFTARFPSNRDETKARVIANNILSKLGTAFYRKYILKMIDFLNIELEKISLGVPVGYYIDIAKLSSSAIISVLKDYNYDILVIENPIILNTVIALNKIWLSLEYSDGDIKQDLDNIKSYIPELAEFYNC